RTALKVDVSSRPIAGAVGLREVPLVSPGVATAIVAASGLFPLCFGRHTLTQPDAVGQGILPTDIDDGMGADTGDRCIALPQCGSRVRVCRRTMPGRLNKSYIGIVRDFVAINQECGCVDEALWLFIRKTIAADRTSHQEFSGRNQCHVVGWRGANGQ